MARGRRIGRVARGGGRPARAVDRECVCSQHSALGRSIAVVGRFSPHRDRPEDTRPDGSGREQARSDAAASPSPASPAEYLVSLESAAGNHAVAAMVQRWRSEPRSGLTHRFPVRPHAVAHPALQRWPTELPIADSAKQTFNSMPEVFRYFAGVPPDKAADAAAALLKELVPFRNGEPYSAENDQEQKQAQELQKKLGITFGEWNGLIFEARARLKPSPRQPSQTPSTPQQGALRNATEVNEVKAYVSGKGPKFPMLYNDTELDGLVDFSKSVGLPTKEFHGIVLTGCRDVKPRSAEQLKDQMHNWKNVVSGTQGHPFKFASQQQFAQFKLDLTSVVQKHELPGHVKLPTSDIRIQGSSLRSPLADDVDIAVCVTKEQYRDICAGRFEKHFYPEGQPQGKEQPLKQDELQKWTYDAMVDVARKAVAKQPCGYMSKTAKGDSLRSASNYILSGKLDGKIKTFIEPLYNMTQEIKAAYPKLGIESVTVILIDGPFDLQPALKL
jgi:hypothetical protein